MLKGTLGHAHHYATPALPLEEGICCQESKIPPKTWRAAANWLEDPVQMYVSIPASQSSGDGAIGMWGRCQLRHVVGSPTEGIVKATGPSWVKGQGGEEARKRRRRV